MCWTEDQACINGGDCDDQQFLDGDPDHADGDGGEVNNDGIISIVRIVMINCSLTMIMTMLMVMASS